MPKKPPHTEVGPVVGVTLGPAAPARAFLHRLPGIINVRQRLILEAIGVSIDLIEQNVLSLKKLAVDGISIDLENIGFSHGQRIMFSECAWSIVDHLYRIDRLLARDTSIQLPSMVEMTKIAKIARDLRNWMDHPERWLGNYVTQKSNSPPVFGVVSYNLVVPEDYTDGDPGKKILKGRTIVIVICSAMQIDPIISIEPFGKPSGRLEVPIDHITLQAFGLAINLSQAQRLAESFGNELAFYAETSCIALAEKIHKEGGASVAESMKAVIGATTLVARATEG